MIPLRVFRLHSKAHEGVLSARTEEVAVRRFKAITGEDVIAWARESFWRGVFWRMFHEDHYGEVVKVVSIEKLRDAKR